MNSNFSQPVSPHVARLDESLLTTNAGLSEHVTKNEHWNLSNCSLSFFIAINFKLQFLKGQKPTGNNLVLNQFSLVIVIHYLINHTCDFKSNSRSTLVRF